MPSLSGVAVASRVAAVATFDADVDPATVEGAGSWALAATGAGAPASVVRAKLQTGSLRVVDLSISPPMSKSQGYSISAPLATDAAGVDMAPDAAAITATAELIQPALHLALWEALSRAIGLELQQLSGTPTTRLVAGLQPGDTTAAVETTLGFPASGRFWAGGVRWTYTGVTPTTFTGVTPYHINGQTVPTYSEVLCDVAAYLPD